MKTLFLDALRGTALAALAMLGAWLLARFGFGRLYYLGILLPALMMIMLLVAWLIHLQADSSSEGSLEPPPAAERPEPASLFASFKGGILKRSDAEDAAPALAPREVLRALLWSAGELAIVSITLYHGAGIGATWFR